MAASSTFQPVKRWTQDSARIDAPSVPHPFLRQLFVLRNVALASQLAAVLVADGFFGVILPVGAMLTVLAGLAAYNGLTALRLRSTHPVSEAELLRQLSVDVIALTLTLSMSGGASNPFAGIFLLPLALGAASLSWAGAWTLAIGSVGCYSVLLVVASPIALRDQGFDSALVLNAGMWLGYAITAAVIAGVMVRITTTLRSREHQIALAREKAASDEHILRIGALAAGAAHELSSPLGSIATIVEDMRRLPRGDAEFAEDLETVSRQLARCRETLATLLSHGQDAFSLPFGPMPVDRMLRGCIDSFSVRRPGSHIVLRIESEGAAPQLLANQALCQAITSLLDNAADASPCGIEVAVGWEDDWLTLRISDRGPGFSPEVVDKLGKLFFTTKGSGKGNGLGLYLANTAVLHAGGSLALGNAAEGGAVVQIRLPISRQTEAQAKAA